MYYPIYEFQSDNRKPIAIGVSDNPLKESLYFDLDGKRVFVPAQPFSENELNQMNVDNEAWEFVMLP